MSQPQSGERPSTCSNDPQLFLAFVAGKSVACFLLIPVAMPASEFRVVRFREPHGRARAADVFCTGEHFPPNWDFWSPLCRRRSRTMKQPYRGAPARARPAPILLVEETGDGAKVGEGSMNVDSEGPNKKMRAQPRTIGIGSAPEFCFPQPLLKSHDTNSRVHLQEMKVIRRGSRWLSRPKELPSIMGARRSLS